MDVSKTHCTTEGVTVASAGESSDERAISVEQLLLVAPKRNSTFCGLCLALWPAHGYEALCDARLASCQNCILPNEVWHVSFQFARESQPRFKWRFGKGDVSAIVHVGLLHAQRV